MLHVLSFLVDGNPEDVRDLGNELHAWILERRQGLDVELVRGPTILLGAAVDAAAEDE